MHGHGADVHDRDAVVVEDCIESRGQHLLLAHLPSDRRHRLSSSFLFVHGEVWLCLDGCRRLLFLLFLFCPFLFVCLFDVI